MMRVSGFTLLFLLSFSFIRPNITMAQETAATLSGHVTDDNGVFLNGATIAIKHEPTGTVTTTQTNNKGIFYLSNLRVGGPYALTITYIGYKEINLNDINLGLGSNPNLDLNLQSLSKSLKEVVVTSARRVPSSGLTVGTRQL